MTRHEICGKPQKTYINNKTYSYEKKTGLQLNLHIITLKISLMSNPFPKQTIHRFRFHVQKRV